MDNIDLTLSPIFRNVFLKNKTNLTYLIACDHFFLSFSVAGNRKKLKSDITELLWHSRTTHPPIMKSLAQTCFDPLSRHVRGMTSHYLAVLRLDSAAHIYKLVDQNKPLSVHIYIRKFKKGSSLKDIF